MNTQNTTDEKNIQPQNLQSIGSLKEELSVRIRRVHGQIKQLRAEFEQKKLKKLVQKMNDNSTDI